MSVVNLTQPMVASSLQALADGVDTNKIDQCLDQFFELSARFGNVQCLLADEGVLRLQSRERLLQEVKMVRAKATLRMMCARLAVRCGEWTGKKIAPYGDFAEVEIPEARQHFKICFENTTARQEIAIEVNPAPGIANRT